METISIIIPFYKGNKYLLNLKEMIDKNAIMVKKKILFEVVIVNDSPWVEIQANRIESVLFTCKMVAHSVNKGIHQARVTGLNNSKGNYIVFLDQDDKISDNYIKYMYDLISKNEADCVIANGVYEVDEGKKIILDNYGKVHFAMRYYAYLIAGNFICSPGQCLIRKSAIPDFWKSHIMQSNCSDDLYLWCIMFRKSKICYCNKLLYKHVNTGENLSLNIENGLQSDLEVYKYLKMEGSISNKLLSIFIMRYQYNIQKLEKRIKEPFKHIAYFFILNGFKIWIKCIALIYKMVGKTCPSIEEEK